MHQLFLADVAACLTSLLWSSRAGVSPLMTSFLYGTKSWVSALVTDWIQFNAFILNLMDFSLFLAIFNQTGNKVDKYDPNLMGSWRIKSCKKGRKGTN